MSWLQKQVSLYCTYADNTGRPATYREVLLSACLDDLDTIIQLRKLDRSDPSYKKKKAILKAKLQCYTPSALLATKAKDRVQEIHRTGLMQLDFDYNDIYEYDIEELKRCVFDLPFIAFCGLSCSGDGFYALASIADPEKLAAYAEHCFIVLEKYGIKADTSKGKKVENLRFLSYDCDMLIRDNPETLRVEHFKTKSAPVRGYERFTTKAAHTGTSALVNASLNKIRTAITGQRWLTVQQVAYTLGGTGDRNLLDIIKSEIKRNTEFKGEEDKYFKCAEVCFERGLQAPLPQIKRF